MKQIKQHISIDKIVTAMKADKNIACKASEISNYDIDSSLIVFKSTKQDVEKLQKDVDAIVKKILNSNSYSLTVVKYKDKYLANLIIQFCDKEVVFE